jgi:hypothetical protein
MSPQVIEKIMLLVKGFVTLGILALKNLDLSVSLRVLKGVNCEVICVWHLALQLLIPPIELATYCNLHVSSLRDQSGYVHIFYVYPCENNPARILNFLLFWEM